MGCGPAIGSEILGYAAQQTVVPRNLWRFACQSAERLCHCICHMGATQRVLGWAPYRAADARVFVG